MNKFVLTILAIILVAGGVIAMAILGVIEGDVAVAFLGGAVLARVDSLVKLLTPAALIIMIILSTGCGTLGTVVSEACNYIPKLQAVNKSVCELLPEKERQMCLKFPEKWVKQGPGETIEVKIGETSISVCPAENEE